MAFRPFAVDAAIPWDVQDFLHPPAFEPASGFPAPEGVQAIFFAGPPWHGKPTRVFAFYGVPKSAQGKAPGIVLVHGGAGTAYADWVKLWNDRGYAAIAFDHFGGLPEKADNHWKRNPEGGPDIGGAWQTAWPIADQWMYHAVADTLLATSLLASLPGVDSGRIGLTGISWGGVVASTVAGLDRRLKFVAPVYGCGFISFPAEDGSQFIGRKDPSAQVTAWRETWDPLNYLPSASMPMLWIAGTNDFAFTPRAWQLSQNAAPVSRLGSLRINMVHGQGPGSAPAEIAAFADAILRGAPPLARITAQGRDGGMAWAGYESPVALKSASLIFTAGDGKWQDRRWESAPAEIDAAHHRLRATLPAGVRAYAFQLTDERGLLTSGDVEPPPAAFPSGP